jgi:hypothetical protein
LSRCNGLSSQNGQPDPQTAKILLGMKFVISLKVKSVVLKQKIASGSSGWSGKGIAPSAYKILLVATPPRWVDVKPQWPGETPMNITLTEILELNVSERMQLIQDVWMASFLFLTLWN